MRLKDVSFKVTVNLDVMETIPLLLRPNGTMIKNKRETVERVGLTPLDTFVSAWVAATVSPDGGVGPMEGTGRTTRRWWLWRRSTY